MGETTVIFCLRCRFQAGPASTIHAEAQLRKHQATWKHRWRTWKAERRRAQ